MTHRPAAPGSSVRTWIDHSSSRQPLCERAVLELSRRVQRWQQHPDGPSHAPKPLRAREQLVRLVAGGRSTREIASQLQVRTDTVRRRLSALYGKTRARNQGALLVWGLEHGVLKQPDLACGPHQRPGQEQGAAAGGNRHRSRATHR